jgi:hypothetical protein
MHIALRILLLIIAIPFLLAAYLVMAVLWLLGVGYLIDRCRRIDESPEQRAGKKAVFGEVMGYAPHNVPAHSCDYSTASISFWYATITFIYHMPPKSD